MHITLPSETLAAALKSSIAAQRSPLESLAHALVTTQPNGRVSFLTTDSQAYVETFVEAQIHEPGTQCLQAALLRPAVAQSGTITIRGDVLTRGRSRYKVPGIDVSAFLRPEPPDKPWQRETVDAVALAAALKAVTYAVKPDNPNANWRGVMLVAGCAWGCDGARGAYCAVNYGGPAAAIPRAQVDRLLDVLTPDAEVSVGNVRTDGRAGLLHVWSPTLQQAITVRLLDLVPMQFRSVVDDRMPEPNEPHVRLNTAQARNLVRQFLPFTEMTGGGHKFRSVDLVRDGADVLLADRSGDCRESLADAIVGEIVGKFTASLAPNLLLDALTAITSPQVDLYPGEATGSKNFVLRPIDAEGAVSGDEVHMFAGLRR
jgi:hypothetical protein